MANATIGQFYEVLGILHARFVKDGTAWETLDKQRLQDCIIREPDRFADAFLEFAANGGKLIVGELKTFLIDRVKPFDPAKFIGQGRSIWRGLKDGDGLVGDEQQDARSLALSQLDLSKLRFEHCLKPGEQRITGEEKLRRLKEEYPNLVRPDAKIGQALLEEPGRRTLKYIESLGITWFDIPGTELRDPDGDRCILYLSLDDGQWYWRYGCLDNDWRAGNPSLVLASDNLDA